MTVTLVCGPPCSGKTTYAQQHATLNAEILDLDTIARTMGSPTLWRHPEPYATQANTQVQQRMAELQHEHPPHDVWILRTLPTGWRRRQTAEQLGASIIVLAPPIHVCLNRSRQDNRPEGTDESIDWWYRQYSPSSADLTLSDWGIGNHGAKTTPPPLPVAHSDRRNGSTRAWKKLAARAIRQATVCYLCGQPLDKTLKAPHPMSPSADHIKPYDQYPELRMQPSNIAACHRVCNRAKSNKPLEQIAPPPSRDW